MQREIWSRSPEVFWRDGGAWTSLNDIVVENDWTHPGPILLRCPFPAGVFTPDAFRYSMPLCGSLGRSDRVWWEAWIFPSDPRPLAETAWNENAMYHSSPSQAPTWHEGGLAFVADVAHARELVSISAGQELWVLLRLGADSSGWRFFSGQISGTRHEAEPAGPWSGSPPSFAFVASSLGTLGAGLQRASLSSGSANLLTLTGRGGAKASAVFSCGAVRLGSVTVTRDSASFSCPGSWFDTAALSTADTMSVSAAVTEYIPAGAELWAVSGGVFSRAQPRAASASFVLCAGADTAPEITAVSLSPVPAATAASFPDLFIQGYTRAAVSVTLRRNTAAALTSVTARFPGGADLSLACSQSGSTETWTGTTAAPVALGGAVSLSALDARGMSAGSTASLSVVSYTRPSIAVQALYRCDAEGNAAEGGAYFKVKAVATVQTRGLSANAVSLFTAGIEGLSASAITSGTAAVLPGRSDANQAFRVVLTLQDRVSEPVTRSVVLPGQRRDLVLLRQNGGTQLGVGMVPTGAGSRSTVQLPSGGEFRIGGRSMMNFGLSSTARVIYARETRLGGDVLRVDFSDRTAPCNETAELWIPNDELSSWTNLPTTIAGGGQMFIAQRCVLFASDDYAFVLLLEFVQKAGRLWLQRGYYNGSGITWLSGWKTLSMTAES